MATRSEQFRSDKQRTGKPKRRSQEKPRKSAWSREEAHVKSTRVKTDSALNVTEEVRKGAPQARAERMRAGVRRVRGSTAS